MKKFAPITIPLGLLLIFAAMLAPFFMATNQLAMTFYPYVYTAGAVLILVTRLFTPAYKGKDIKLRGLYRIEKWSSIVFCAAAIILVMRVGAMRDWVALTLAGAILTLFANIAIPMRESKLAKNTDRG